MKYLATFPMRIVMIPVMYVALVGFALAIPFVCLFGTITYKGKKYL